MALHLRGHGGLCCGISHIHGFPNSLNYMEAEITSAPDQFLGYAYPRNILRNKWGDTIAQSIPAETTLDRLDRYLKWLSVEAKYGVTEVVLTTSQAITWESILLERGFKMVSECRNSNSMNKIRIYHLCRDEPNLLAPFSALTQQVSLR